MPTKHKVVQGPDGEQFGQRLALYRRRAGYSQYDLAREIGVSQRMVAYYEGETEHPPGHLLVAIAKALGVTADQLLGLDRADVERARDTRLWRRFKQIEKLPSAQRRRIVQILDAFLGMDREQKATSSK